MTLDSSGLADEMTFAVGYNRPTADGAGLTGHGVAELFGPDGKLKQRVEFTNIVTEIGDQVYGERGSGIGSPAAAPTAMQLGTGVTAVAKNGAGSWIGTVVANSHVAIGTPTSALNAGKRRITYTTTWAAATATSNGISEVVLTNQLAATQTVAPLANTLARALLSPTVNKGASDSLTITWQHDVGT